MHKFSELIYIIVKLEPFLIIRNILKILWTESVWSTHGNWSFNPHQWHLGKDNRSFGDGIYFNIRTINSPKVVKEAILDSFTDSN